MFFIDALAFALIGLTNDATTQPLASKLVPRACPSDLDYVPLPSLLKNRDDVLSLPHVCANRGKYSPRWKDVGHNTDILKTSLCGGRQNCGTADDKDNVLMHIIKYTNDLTTLRFLNIFTDGQKYLQIACAELDQDRVAGLNYGTATMIEIRNACISSNSRFGLDWDTFSKFVCIFADKPLTAGKSIKDGVEWWSTHSFAIKLWGFSNTQTYRNMLCEKDGMGELKNLAGYGALNFGLDWQQLFQDVKARCAGPSRPGK
ncbi:hypothetical protein EJ08DRAFT_666667 [Tothia fuscella]|uniref:Uncharacterized protein n=1 Tax=Tothia fuscella TaxID=1048955 RepID=A0A9P4NEB9_9PEZI|nr:hypothetical protein EJ08DRAFT_666667 [Tothia fuscella]